MGHGVINGPRDFERATEQGTASTKELERMD